MQSKKKLESTIVFSENFFSDIENEDCLYATLIRSPVSSRKFISLQVNLQENCFIFFARDIPKKNFIEIFGQKMPLLCEGEICYEGEPLAILCGPNLKILNEIKNDAELFFDKTEIEKNITGEKICERKILSGLARENSLEFENLFCAKENLFIRENYSKKIDCDFFGEPCGAFSEFKNGKLKIYSPCDRFFQLKKNLCLVTDLPEEKISICKTNAASRVQGDFFFDEYAACFSAIAATKTKKSVKFIFSREEHKKFAKNSAFTQTKFRVSVNPKGKIVALDAKIEIEVGFQNPFAKECVDRLAISAISFYDVKNFCVCVVAKKTCAPPAFVDLEKIDSHSFFAIENLFQKIAYKTGISPLELRLNHTPKNFGQKNSLPFLFPLSFEKIHDVLKTVCIASDFERKNAAYRLAEKNLKNNSEQNFSPFSPPLRGIALSCAFQGSVFFGSNLDFNTEKIQIACETKDSVSIFSPPLSKSIKKIWTALSSTILEIKAENVHFEYEKSAQNFDSCQIPESLCEKVGIATTLLKKCLESAKNKRSKNKIPFTIKRSISNSEKKQWNSENFSERPFHSTSFATAVLEVEFNAETFCQEIREIWLCVDAGKILYPKAAEIEIKKSAENILKKLTKNDLPRLPKINLTFLPSENESEQIASLCENILPSAFTAAISQSLSLSINSLPVLKNSISETIKKSKNAENDFFDALTNLIQNDEQSSIVQNENSKHKNSTSEKKILTEEK